MRKMTVLGATALLVAGLVAAPATAFAAPIAAAPVAATPAEGEQTCPKDGKIDVGGEQETLVVTAPDGYLITEYCVKAGSANNGAGPEVITVDPPAAEVTISHSSGKAISHYTLVTAKAEPTPEPTVPGSEPTPTEGTTVPGTDVPAEPTPEPTEPAAVPVDESAAPVEGVDGTTAPAEEPEVLAATGASTAIGFALIALALVGGGVTLLVLRRKGVLGS